MIAGIASCSVFLAVTLVVNAQPDWPNLKITAVATGAVATTHLAHAGDGSGRLFIVEQAGMIRIVQSNQFLDLPFLDIRDRVGVSWEEGLFSMAWPPGNQSKDHFYVDYTRIWDFSTVVSRFHIGTNSNQADPASEEVILTVPQPNVDHSGGQIAFGPDGFLYIGMGDGARFDTAQDPLSLSGKMLRIDVEGVVNGYAVPTNNPFVAMPGFRPEIWSMGFRNPWRFSFDRLTGDLFVGDVGAESREEIDFQSFGSRGGENYGWPIKEGSLATGFSLDTMSELVPPIFEYGDGLLRKCVIGGYVYRGPPTRMNGMYFYTDYMVGGIYGLIRTGTNWNQQPLMAGVGAATFGEDEEGRLYLPAGDTIYRIEDTGQVCPPIFNPLAEVLAYANFVAITTLTPNAALHYTTDGREPTENEPRINSGESLHISVGTTLKARAFRTDLQPSDITSGSYTNLHSVPPVPRLVLAGTGPAVIVRQSNKSAAVILDGSQSFALDSTSLDYTWADKAVLLANQGVRVTNSFSVGTHSIYLTVTDEWGLAATNRFALEFEVMTAHTMLTRLLNALGKYNALHPTEYRQHRLLSPLRHARLAVARRHFGLAKRFVSIFQDRVNQELADSDPFFAELYAGTGQAIINGLSR